MARAKAVTPTSFSFEMSPEGPFDLDNEAAHFGGWPRLEDGGIVMAFPVEGWKGSAAVVMRQDEDGIAGDVHGAPDDGVAQRAWQQALATVSLDVDASPFAEVADRDPVIGKLRTEYKDLRPVLFHSPYEAACAFLIGHRITIQQTRRIRQRMSEEFGAKISVAGQTFPAFPDPNVLLRIDEFPGVSSPKIDRLHGAARAALDGTLDREHLRSIPEADAIKELRKINGVGDFFAEGILMRGAGLVDAVTNDDMTPRAIELLYHLKERPDHAAVLRRAQAWRPYRMWALVLLNVWVRSQPPEVVGRRQIRNQLRPSRPKPKRAAPK